MNNLDTCKATFARLLPELECMASSQFRYLDPEAKEEAIQNTIALTWKSYHSLILQGRGDEQGIIKSVLFYSIKQTKVGRTFPEPGNTEKPQDVYRNARRGRVRIEMIDLNLFLSDMTPVPDQVSFRLDIRAFFATLNDRQRLMTEDLMLGMGTKECASKYDVTPAAVSQFRSRFRDLFETFMAG